MPLVQEIISFGRILTGIWKITESAGELLTRLQLTESESDLYHTFRNDLRKRQWLASRVLLRSQFPHGQQTVLYNPHGKPYLDPAGHHISISHAGDMAAVAWSEHGPVGVDIERMKERVERVKERFLQPPELEFVVTENRLAQLYVMWCGKEALYKIYGNPGIDFRDDIRILPFDYLCNENPTCRATIRLDGNIRDFRLSYRRIEDYMVVVAGGFGEE